MSTAFDDVIDEIKKRGFHNHRLEDHSIVMSRGICATCAPCANRSHMISQRTASAAGSTPHRPLDGRASWTSSSLSPPGISQTSHAYAYVSRISPLLLHTVTAPTATTTSSDLVGALHRKKPDAVLVATVLVGLAENVLNVPDRVKPFLLPNEFKTRVLPRLSSGDAALWGEFPQAMQPQPPGRP